MTDRDRYLSKLEGEEMLRYLAAGGELAPGPVHISGPVAVVAQLAALAREGVPGRVDRPFYRDRDGLIDSLLVCVRRPKRPPRPPPQRVRVAC